jgi:hypothetical protein
LERFLVTKTTLSYETYIKLLKEATTLYERECISLKSLIRMTISRSHLELNIILPTCLHFYGLEHFCTASKGSSPDGLSRKD